MIEMNDTWQEYPLKVNGKTVWRRKVGNVFAEVHATADGGWEFVAGVFRRMDTRITGTSPQGFEATKQQADIILEKFKS